MGDEALACSDGSRVRVHGHTASVIQRDCVSATGEKKRGNQNRERKGCAREAGDSLLSHNPRVRHAVTAADNRQAQSGMQRNARDAVA